ncbi:MAG TPA: prolyl oligopeptidase family serine peptidase, partial [Phycisphaerae bacterium]|nr:prolyl oligopeptidase family serine peptidase [Phycisphaerae bacterium]
HYLHKDLPPILILHGTADKTVPYQGSLNFQTQEKSLNNECDLITLQDAPHNITTWQKSAPTYPQQIADWLHHIFYTPPTTTPAR